MQKIKLVLIWIKNLLTPLTEKAAIAFLQRRDFKITKK